ncbi:MAG TPA: LD-carboxypeptidase [Polyangiaceae bacterium]|nr:LD-carboxypeptidase [Polyangiaceae bacterium]
MIIAPALKPGDPIRVVSPSGPFDPELVARGVAWLGERFEVRPGDAPLERQGYLAAPDELRLAELNAALRDRDARAVVATRGGYGLNRIAHAVDARALRESPKWIVGFSDVTALHVEALRAGVASLHADNVAGLGRGDDRSRASWLSALEHPLASRRMADLEIWRSGVATGPVVGGNLTVLFTCFAAGRLEIPRGAVLLLEDVGEAPYRLDRMLSGLLVGGALDGVAAVLVGDFVDSEPGRYGVPASEVLRERLGELKVPLLAGLPVGHGRINEPVHLGLPVRVDGTTATATFGSLDAPTP